MNPASAVRADVEEKLRMRSHFTARFLKVNTNGGRKAVRELQRVHEQVANQGADFVHKPSRRMAGGYQLIAVEKLIARLPI